MMGLFLVYVQIPIGDNQQSGYLIGILIAILLLAYLVYSLLKPEKF